MKQAKLKEVEMLETVTVSSWDAQEQTSVASKKDFSVKVHPVILSMGALGVSMDGWTNCLIRVA